MIGLKERLRQAKLVKRSSVSSENCVMTQSEINDLKKTVRIGLEALREWALEFERRVERLEALTSEEEAAEDAPEPGNESP
jgi:transposase-like protein